MKFTKIRNRFNEKLNETSLQVLSIELLKKLNEAGFITDWHIVNSQSIKLGMHSKSFTVDVKRLGYNARYNPFSRTKLGYTRTSTPTWDQRVQFNDIVNSVLNEFGITCNVKSGPFTIRKGGISLNENDWYSQKPDYLWHNESRGFTIESIEE